MSMLFVMIPLALVLLALAVAAFFWAVRTGQFDDLEKHGMLVLFDDEPVVPASRAGRPSVECAARAGDEPATRVERRPARAAAESGEPRRNAAAAVAEAVVTSGAARTAR